MFKPGPICYGKQSDEIRFDMYSEAFTYEWKLVETQEGLTGYKESGSGKIPAMEVINTTNKYQPLAYEVSCLYQGEIYATHLVTLWV